MKKYIATTRFNNKTWNENEKWREKNDWRGCIYCTPIKIRDFVIYKSGIFIIEMNNDMNKIMGIGFIKNFIHLKNKKQFRVYSDKNYNRYIYKSNIRVDYVDFNIFEKKIINIFEILLFKGYKHSKRGQGISVIPKWMYTKDIYKYYILFFEDIFIKRGYNIS